MKALVTGVGGFCGAHLVSRLRREPFMEIAGFDRKAAAAPELGLDGYYQGDVTDAAGVDSAVRSFAPDWLFHLAGVSGSVVPAPCMYTVNVTGTVHVLEAVRRNHPACRVGLIGSFAEYGPADPSSMPVTEETPCRPVGPYGITKYAATLTGIDYAKRYGLRVVVARPSNIVGPGVPESLVVGAMLGRAKKAFSSLRPVMKVGDFESERDFVDVSDVADAYVRLARSNVSGEVFNICSGRAYSIRRVAEMLIANSSRTITADFDPNLVPASVIRCLYGSHEKATKAIGFRPMTPLEESLKAAWCAEIETGVTCE